MEYNADLFDDSTISQMIAHFQNLLTEITKNPDQEIANYSLSPEEEDQLYIDDFNDALEHAASSSY